MVSVLFVVGKESSSIRKPIFITTKDLAPRNRNQNSLNAKARRCRGAKIPAFHEMFCAFFSSLLAFVSCPLSTYFSLRLCVFAFCGRFPLCYRKIVASRRLCAIFFRYSFSRTSGGVSSVSSVFSVPLGTICNEPSTTQRAGGRAREGADSTIIRAPSRRVTRRGGV